MTMTTHTGRIKKKASPLDASTDSFPLILRQAPTGSRNEGCIGRDVSMYSSPTAERIVDYLGSLGVKAELQFNGSNIRSTSNEVREQIADGIIIHPENIVAYKQAGGVISTPELQELVYEKHWEKKPQKDEICNTFKSGEIDNAKKILKDANVEFSEDGNKITINNRLGIMALAYSGASFSGSGEYLNHSTFAR